MHGQPGLLLKSGLNVTIAGVARRFASASCARPSPPRPASRRRLGAPAAQAAFKDGTVAVDLDPLSLLVRLCTTVPPSKMHLVRYAGVLASAHKSRPLVVPPHLELLGHDEPGCHRCLHLWRRSNFVPFKKAP
jgi:hypothetical protein